MKMLLEDLERRLVLSSAVKNVLPASVLKHFSVSNQPTLLAGPSAATLATTSPSGALTSAATTAITTLAGALTGRVVYTQGGHGYTYMDEGNGTFIWETQRPYESFAGNVTIVEDAGNQDQMTYFADYALHEGATVVPIRAVGHQDNMVIVDNSDTGFSVVSGTWSNSTQSPYWSDNNGNDSVHYRSANGTGNPNSATAVAQWTPNLPAAGFYPVYAWYNPGTNRNTSAAYTINFAGGSTTVRVNQQLTGDGWVYLGTYYFAAGTTGNVQLSNASSSTGATIADAIRFGNGRAQIYDPTTGVAIRYGATTTFAGNATVGSNTMSIEDLAGLYWAYASRGWTGNGARVSTSTVDNGSTSDDNTKNFGAPDRWATYMNQSASGSMTDRIWLSFHSNASGPGSGSRGDYGLINTVPTPNQSAYALLMGMTISQDMTAQNSRWLYPWGIQPYTYVGGYSEISNNIINGEFDATIVEVAYHDNAEDTALLVDPKVRDAVAKSALHGIQQYFETYGGLTNTTTMPDAPTDLRAITNSDGSVTLNWTAGPSGSPYGNAATSYKVYTSPNGYGFGNPVTVSSGTTLTVTGLTAGAPTYFEVTAVNSGGESFASPVVAVQPQSGRKAPILIVNGFNRLDSWNDQQQTSDDYQGLNGNETYDRVRERYNNTQDYSVLAATGIDAYNNQLGFDSVSETAINNGEVSLAGYQNVIWMAGDQGTYNGTFTTNDQTAVTNYLAGGGNIFVTGSDVGLDLVGNGKGASFFQNTLHAGYSKDSSATHSFAAGVAGSAFASVPTGSFDDGTHGGYNIFAPDVLTTNAGSTIALNYSGGSGGAAAVQYLGTGSATGRTIVMGFPVESVYTTSQQNAIWAGVLAFFNVNSPTISTSPGKPTLAAATDSGSSNSDGITNYNNSSAAKELQFTVPSTTVGATVAIYVDGVKVGSTAAVSTTTTVNTSGTFTIADGTHLVTARQTLPGNAQSGDSTAFSITIDTTPPTATVAAVTPNPRNGSLASENVTFSEKMGSVPFASFQLKFNGGANLLTGSQTVTTTDSQTYTINNLSSLTTASGNYVILVGAPASDLAGNAMTVAASTSFAVNTINLSAGTNTVSVSAGAGTTNIYVNNNTGTPTYSWSFTSGQQLIINGSTGNDSLSLTGVLVPNVIFNGGSGNDSLTLNSGTSYTLSSDASAATANLSLNVLQGANLTIASNQHLAAVSISGTAAVTPGGNKTLVFSGLTISGTGSLDLADNELVVQYSGTSPAGTITQYLAQAFNNGIWNGSGLWSSSAASDATRTHGLGYAEASDLSINTYGSAVIIKYALYGDDNLDGVVNQTDYSLLLAGMNHQGSGWFYGDLNYDGATNLDDFSMFIDAFNGI